MGLKWLLRTLWRILHMFLDILEFTEENKKDCLGKTVLKMWSQKLTRNGLKVHKTTSRKKCKNLKINKNKNNENVYNLWRILGTKLPLLVDFWDQLFKTVFPIFFLFSTLNSKMSRNMRKVFHKVCTGQNLPHESPNFTNYFFQSDFMYNLSQFSSSQIV